MTESNAEKNADSTSSSPVAPDETIRDLDVRLSEEEMNDVKGGMTVKFEYKPQKPDGSSI